MSTALKEMAMNQEPKLTNLSHTEKGLYEFGIMLLGNITSENFLDLPLLPEDKYGSDGLFYSIPYLHDVTLWSSGNSRTILVVYKIENKTSYCPLRIEAVLESENNYSIIVYDQTGKRTKKKSLFIKENGKFYTDIKGYDKVTLSELVVSK